MIESISPNDNPIIFDILFTADSYLLELREQILIFQFPGYQLGLIIYMKLLSKIATLRSVHWCQ